MKYTFLTRLSVENCKDKLIKSMQSRNGRLLDFILNNPKKIKGKVSKNNTFWIRPPGLSKDAYAPIFHGEFSSSDKGTQIQGKFRLNRFVFLSSTSWEIVVICVLVVGVITGRIDIVFISIVMATFMILLVFGGSKKRKQRIINFIQETFEAEKVNL